MDDHENSVDISLAPTESIDGDELGHCADYKGEQVEGLVASGPGNNQMLSSSNDEGSSEDSESSEIDSDEDIEDATGGEIRLVVTAKKGSNVVSAISLNSLLKHLRLERSSLPIPINISNSSGKNIVTELCNGSPNTIHSVGSLSNPYSIMKRFGLKEICIYKLKYLGSSIRWVVSEDDASLEEKNVIDFLVVDAHGVDSSSEDSEVEEVNEILPEFELLPLPSLSVWAAEAANKQLVPAQLAESVLAFFDIELNKSRVKRWLLQSNRYLVFTSQVGYPCESGAEWPIELEYGNCGYYYTTFAGSEYGPRGFIRKGKEFCELAGFCMEKEGRKRGRAPSTTPSRKKLTRQSERRRHQEAPLKVTPTLSRQRPTSTGNIQRPAVLSTPSPGPNPAIPNQSGQQAQQGSLGLGDGRLHQEPNPLEQQQRQQQQTNAEHSAAELVVDCLLNRSDLDEQLICSYLSIFGRLPEKTREIDGRVILSLAAGTTGTRLKMFLEAAVGQHQ